MCIIHIPWLVGPPTLPRPPSSRTSTGIPLAMSSRCFTACGQWPADLWRCTLSCIVLMYVHRLYTNISYMIILRYPPTYLPTYLSIYLASYLSTDNNIYVCMYIYIHIIYIYIIYTYICICIIYICIIYIYIRTYVFVLYINIYILYNI